MTFAATVRFARLGVVLINIAAIAAAEPPAPKACIDGTGPGWKTLAGDDFENVNCDPDTWTWEDGFAKCTGKPVGVIRAARLV